MLARPNQSIEDHLSNVCNLVNPKYYFEVCKFINYSHDMGKARNEWQDYLQNSVNNLTHDKISHSKESAEWILFQLNKLGIKKEYYHKIILEIIASHHSKNLDFSRVYESCEHLIDSRFFDYSVFDNLKRIPKNELTNLVKRYLFSTLVDSDVTDCQIFSGLKIPKPENFSILADNFFSKYYEKFTNVEGINKCRRDIFEKCKDVDNAVGIYSLNVPTGGGKTLSSVAFALNKAIKTNAQRIFFILPFTTLVRQTTNVLKQYFDNVHEIHSQVEIDENDEETIQKSELDYEYYVKDSFNGQIIVTTHVAFLESVFGKKYRSFRNLSDSILVFDEVQAFGINNTMLLIDACEHLTKFGTSSLISTATQINYEKLFEQVKHTVKIQDILDEKSYLDEFDRNTFVFEKGEKTYKDIASYIHEESTLIITNTRKQARQLYHEMKQIHGDYVFHISKNMMRKDITHNLNKVKELLISKEKVILISTNLIEAGVDVDFRRVVRFMCGIPSIVQSAGRCNRNMKYDKNESKVYIVQCEKDDEQGLFHCSKTFKAECEITKLFIGQSDVKIERLLEADFQKFGRPSIVELVNNQFRKDLFDINKQNIGELFRSYKAIEENNSVQIFYYCADVDNELRKEKPNFKILSDYSIDISKKEAQRFLKIGEHFVFEDYQYSKEYGIKEPNEEVYIV